MFEALRAQLRMIRRKRAATRIVARAIVDLDAHIAGWAASVTRRIVIDSSQDCVMAQIYGDWNYAMSNELGRAIIDRNIDAFAPECNIRMVMHIEIAWNRAIEQRKTRRAA